MRARSDDLARLQRWIAAGGGWQVAEQSDGSVTVRLLRCDGGEELERFTSAEPELLRSLAAAVPASGSPDAKPSMRATPPSGGRAAGREHLRDGPRLAPGA